MSSGVLGSLFGVGKVVLEYDPVAGALKAANALVAVLLVSAGLSREGDKPASASTETKSDRGVALGKTKIFLRKAAFEALEAVLARKYSKSAVRVQTAFRWVAER